MVTSGKAPAPGPEAASALGPLSGEDVGLVISSHARLASVRRADVLATFNGWTFAGSAVLCLPFAILDPTALIVAVGLVLIARIELQSRSLLRIPDVKGVRRLVGNQVALFLLVAVYCAWRVWAGLSGPVPSELPEFAPYLERAPPDISQTLDRLQKILVFGLYGGLFVASALYQGGCAFYYFTQRRPIERYLAETPDWVRELERKLGAAT